MATKLTSFGIITDLHNNQTYAGNGNTKTDEVLKVDAAVSELNGLGVDFLAVLGDWIYDTNLVAEEDFYTALNEMATSVSGFSGPIHRAIGNWEDSVTDPTVPWTVAEWIAHMATLSIFESDSQYYSFDQGGIHFIVIDDHNAATVDGTQESWVIADIVATSLPIIVLCHYDIYTSHQLLDIFQNNAKVIGLFHGHVHTGDGGMQGIIHHFGCKAIYSGAYPSTRSYYKVDVYDNNDIVVTGYYNGSDSAVLYNLKATPDGTKTTFGAASGQTNNGVLDTYIDNSNTDASFGSGGTHRLMSPRPTFIDFKRSSDIPTTHHIDRAFLYVKPYVVDGDQIAYCYALNKQVYIGNSEDPETGGNSTFDNVRDYNDPGGADVQWGDGTFSDDDLVGEYSRTTLLYIDAYAVEVTDVNTYIVLDVTERIRDEQAGSNEYGFCLLGQDATNVRTRSFDTALDTDKPYLEVYHNLTEITSQSHSVIARLGLVTLTGTGFGTYGTTITFTDSDTTVHTCTITNGYTDSSITFQMPLAASLGSGTITITTIDSKSDTSTITVTSIPEDTYNISIGLSIGI